MKKLLFALFLLPLLGFSQYGKTHLVAMQSTYGNGTQYMNVYSPNDSATGFHPVIICASGAGEVGTFNSAVGSLGAYCKAGGLPAFKNAVKGGTSTFYVIELYKPNQDATGAFQPTRYRDAIDWVYKNLSNADHSQVYATGLSLSGGGVWALMTDTTALKMLAATAPLTGTQDAYDPSLFGALNKFPVPFTTIESMDDANGSTAGTAPHYQLYGNIYKTTYPVAASIGRFIYPLTGGHSGAWIKGYDTAHISYPVLGGSTFANNPNLYEWFLTFSKPALNPVIVVPPPVVIPPPPPVIITKIILAKFGIYDDTGTLIFNITVYNDGTTLTETK